MAKVRLEKLLEVKRELWLNLMKALTSKSKFLIPCHMPYDELDKRLFNSFCRARYLGYIIRGPGLTAEANQYSLKMGLTEFQASTSWLESFKEHHNMDVCYSQWRKC